MLNINYYSDFSNLQLFSKAVGVFSSRVHVFIKVKKLFAFCFICHVITGNGILTNETHYYKNESFVNFTVKSDDTQKNRDVVHEKNYAEAILFYISEIQNEEKGHKNESMFYMKGRFLQNQTEFTINLPHETSQIIDLMAHEQYVYLLYRKQSEDHVNHLIRILRNGTETTICDLIHLKINSIALDWITSNIYLLVSTCANNPCSEEEENQQIGIHVCNTNKTCILLHNKFMKQPQSFAIFPKYRMLFWIEKKYDKKFAIIRSSMDATSAKAIQRNLNLSKLLTIDWQTEEIYWAESTNSTETIYSVKFDGTNKKIIATNLLNMTSLAIYEDKLYWRDSSKKSIFSCNKRNCVVNKEEKFSSNIGGKLFIYEPKLHQQQQMEKNPCFNRCSDLCLLTSSSNFSCQCVQTQTMSPNKIFCENTTLLVTYGNDLYFLGQALSTTPIKRQVSLKMKFVSALAYNTVNGYVILAETGEQNIYLLNPSTEELLLLVSDGSGTITLMEFDDYGNNLYWINPVENTIKVISFETRTMATIFQGGPTYIPFDLTLAPHKRYMFVAFLKMSTTVVIERMSMDVDQETRKKFYEDNEALLGDLKLYYLKDAEYLFVFDKEMEQIINYQGQHGNDNPEQWISSKFANSYRGKFSGSVTSLNNVLIWTEKDAIYYGKTRPDFPYHPESLTLTSIHRLSVMDELITHKSENKTLNMVGIMPAIESNSSCLIPNWKCKYLCLASEKKQTNCICEAPDLFKSFVHKIITGFYDSNWKNCNNMINFKKNLNDNLELNEANLKAKALVSLIFNNKSKETIAK